jgi:uncharacterized protein (DUF58 family)
VFRRRKRRQRSGLGLAISGDLPQGRWRAWLDRRVPPRRIVRLTQKNVFIFPPQSGLAFVLLVVLLILGAINYQNSLVFALAFLLASLFAVTIGHTFRNLAGLEVEAAGVEPVFVGEHAVFTLRLARTGPRRHHAVRIGFPGEAAQLVDLDEETELRVRVPVLATHRGWFHPGRLRIETTWPLGLLRAWTWIDADQHALVWPRPLPGGTPAQAEVASGEGDVVVRSGNEDFLGLREYRPGDPLKHVAWKTFAREGELLVKDFGGYADRRLWLDWDALPGVDTETRLSRLTAWSLELDAAGDEFGLRLPGGEVPPGRGPAHREAVLRALALHGLAPAGAAASGDAARAADEGVPAGGEAPA